MIDYIRGTIDSLTPTEAVVYTPGGVAYSLGISLNTFTALEGKEEVRLFVYESIREDAWQLFGFSTREERAIFLCLISVPGVGGQTARMVLSSFTPSELIEVVRREDAAALKRVKGIGPKAAARMIVDLRDKVEVLSGEIALADSPAPKSAAASGIAHEAIDALAVLGFPPAMARKVVAAVLDEEPDASVERVIKLSLKRM